MYKRPFNFGASFLACLLVTSFLSGAMAEDSNLCKDLGQFACAPGEYNDGTGVVKSDEAVEEAVTSYAARQSAAIRGKVERLITGPENEHFFNVSKGALGLNSAPQCLSKAPADVAKCRDNVLEGLTTLTRKMTLGNFVPQPGIGRTPNLEAMNYILSSDSFDKMIKDVGEGFTKEFGSKDQTRKIETKIFPGVKALMIKRLRELPIAESTRSMMIAKINGIRFGGTDCSELANGSRSLSTVLMPNAFYMSNRNTFNFCAGFFAQSSSDFNAVSTIAHELAHAIDPCGISDGPEGAALKYVNKTDWLKAEAEFPIPNVIQCLRGPRSVQAIAAGRYVFEGGPMGAAPAAGNYGGYGDYSAGPSSKPALSAKLTALPNVNFCENDQITESFSDWLATEVLPDYMEQNYKLTPTQYVNGYANTFRVGCSGAARPVVGSNGGIDAHPTTAARLNKIILAHPKVRKQMGCSERNPDVDYCEAKVIIPNAASTAAPERTREPGPKRTGAGSAQ